MEVEIGDVRIGGYHIFPASDAHSGSCSHRALDENPIRSWNHVGEPEPPGSIGARRLSPVATRLVTAPQHDRIEFDVRGGNPINYTFDADEAGEWKCEVDIGQISIRQHSHARGER